MRCAIAFALRIGFLPNCRWRPRAFRNSDFDQSGVRCSRHKMLISLAEIARTVRGASRLGRNFGVPSIADFIEESVPAKAPGARTRLAFGSRSCNNKLVESAAPVSAMRRLEALPKFDHGHTLCQCQASIPKARLRMSIPLRSLPANECVGIETARKDRQPLPKDGVPTGLELPGNPARTARPAFSRKTGPA